MEHNEEAMKINIKETRMYRDGGTVEITTTEGEVYWLPGRTYNDRSIMKGPDFFGNNCVVVTDSEEIYSLIVALATDSNIYHDIKRRIPK
jgi:hypothetical protein